MITRRSSYGYGLGDTVLDPATIGPDISTIQTMIGTAPSTSTLPVDANGIVGTPVSAIHQVEDTIGWNNGPIVKGMALLGAAGLLLIGYLLGKK